jgi:hypothetical protein
MSEAYPPITSFRERLASLIRSQSDHERRDVVVLGVDGIPFDLGRACWSGAQVWGMRSVFPTTSATAWLSSLSGADVATHGLPGVVFKLDGAADALVNVYEYRGPLGCPDGGNIFSDARDSGYLPVSIRGDLESIDCSWRELLLRHSDSLAGFRFYTSQQHLTPEELCSRLLRSITETLETAIAGRPRLLWCFVDADQHIHHYGYDAELTDFLQRLDILAGLLVQRGLIVVAHSDHGLVRTQHEPAIQQQLDRMEAEFGCVLGGAGRTRWVYCSADQQVTVRERLERRLPSSVRVHPADAFFPPHSLARARVGDLILVATGDEFITFDGYQFDHGSDTDTELDVPLAVWM